MTTAMIGMFLSGACVAMAFVLLGCYTDQRSRRYAGLMTGAAWAVMLAVHHDTSSACQAALRDARAMARQHEPVSVALREALVRAEIKRAQDE